jgi:hypothetical protein
MDTIDLLNDISTDGAKAEKAEISEARLKANRANAKTAGAPKGKGQADKLTYDPDRLASNLADRIISGRGIPISPYAAAGTPTDIDRAHVARITGIPAEEFQAKITAKLQLIADKTTERVLEKLEDGSNQRLSDLNMTMAISIDKLAAISGRTAQSGNVSVTVNNYGSMSREQMLATVQSDRKTGAIEV